MKRIYKVDPLECPKCNAQMRILAFLHNPAEISKIIDSLGIPPFAKLGHLPHTPYPTDISKNVFDFPIRDQMSRSFARTGEGGRLLHSCSAAAGNEDWRNLATYNFCLRFMLT
jgi:hypothetical protein